MQKTYFQENDKVPKRHSQKLNEIVSFDVQLIL